MSRYQITALPRGYTVHAEIQRPTDRGFPIARTRWYSACVRNDYYLDVDLNTISVCNRKATFDGGALFCAPEDVVATPNYLFLFWGGSSDCWYTDR